MSRMSRVSQSTFDADTNKLPFTTALHATEKIQTFKCLISNQESVDGYGRVAVHLRTTGTVLPVRTVLELVFAFGTSMVLCVKETTYNTAHGEFS